MTDVVPKYSIIIPVKEINDYVRETVPYIQSLDLSKWELIIVPNNLQDNEWNDDERISLFFSGQVGPAEKRDMAGKLARGEILVFLDDDSFPHFNLLTVAEKYLADSSISALGGPAITPENNSYWQKVSGAVFMTNLTGGNPKRYLSVGQNCDVDDWPSVNFMIRKSVFCEVGGFDSPYWPGEDTHLCLKLVRKSKRIVYVPELIVWHHRRSGFFKHIKQVGAYGLHRGYFARHLPDTSFKLKYFIPTFVTLMITSVFLIPLLPSAFDVALWIGIIVYLSGVLIGCVRIAQLTSWQIAIGAIPYVIATHLSYGSNFLRGLIRTSPLVSKLR